MKHLSTYLVPALLALTLACTRDNPASTDVEKPHEIHTDVQCIRAVVRFDESIAETAEKGTLEIPGAVSMQRLFPDAGKFEPRTRREGLHRWYLLDMPQSLSITKAESDLSALPGIEHVEFLPEAHLLTNDRFFKAQWDLWNPSAPGTDINVVPVWENYTTGSPDVIVAIVDGGVQLNHEDLAANCLPHGHWNFVDDSENITPHDHGVHVAGTIAAISNNMRGIAGIAGGDTARGQRGVRILSTQIFAGSGSSEQTASPEARVRAIKWGADHGAVISQNSWGHLYDLDNNGIIDEEELAIAAADVTTESEKAAIDYFIRYAGCDNDGNQLPDSPMKGGLVVFAAGNDNIPYGCPANYENVIGVGATASDGSKSTFSNYGDWVDIYAPGTNIASTVSGNSYASYNGTSMACPHVSGVAALLVSWYGGQGFTVDMLRERLMKGAAVNPSGLLFLDALGSFEYGNTGAPESPTVLSATLKGTGASISFSCSPDCETPAAGYMLIAGKDEAELRAANPHTLPPTIKTRAIETTSVSAPGARYSIDIDELGYDSTWYFAVAGYTSTRHFGAFSSPVSLAMPQNRAPVISTSYTGDYSFHPGEQVRIEFTASDAEGHALIFSMLCDSEGHLETDHANPSHVWFVLDCNQVKDNLLHEVAIIVRDAFGKESSLHFSYRVIPDSAPVALDISEGILLETNPLRHELKLSDCFADPDGDELSYTVSCNPEGIVSASLSGLWLIVEGLSDGQSTLLLTATDPYGLHADAQILVKVRTKNQGLDCYPSVVSDVLNVATGDKTESAIIRIISSTGKKVLDTSRDCSAFSPAVLDVSSLTPGRYTLTVSYGSYKGKRTFVKI